MAQPNGNIGHFLKLGQAVRHKKKSDAHRPEGFFSLHAFLLKRVISDGKKVVYYWYVGVNFGGDCKPKPCTHA